MIRLLDAKNPKLESANKHSSDQFIIIELSNLELTTLAMTIKDHIEEAKGRYYSWYRDMIELEEVLEKIGVEAREIQTELTSSKEKG